MPGYSYARYRVGVHSYITNLQGEEKRIAVELDSLASRVRLSESGPAFVGFLSWIVFYGLGLIVGFTLRFPEHQVLWVGFFLGLAIGGLSAYLAGELKYKKESKIAVDELKEKLADHRYYEWWQKRMPKYDYESFSTIERVLEKE